MVDCWSRIVVPDEGAFAYNVFTDRSPDEGRGETEERDRLKTLFEAARSGMLGDAVSGRSVLYHDLALTVSMFESPETYALAPAWYVATDANQFRVKRVGEDVAAGRTEQLIELTTLAHQRTGAAFTYAEPLSEAYSLALHPDRERVSAGELEQLYWLNVFDSAFADAIGREKLLALDAYECEELPDGSVSLQMSERPTERDVPERRRLLEALG
jgi:hypothetical protein